MTPDILTQFTRRMHIGPQNNPNDGFTVEWHPALKLLRFSFTANSTIGPVA